MHCSKKNSYLQLLYGTINPELLNRCIDKARNVQETDPHDTRPPLQRLCSHQPDLMVENIDLTRRKCGYGKRVLDQLKDDLQSYDNDIVMRAVTTIGDLVINPEDACQVIKLRIPDKMCLLFDKENTFLTERLCRTFAKLAIIPNGKLHLVRNNGILNRFKSILEEDGSPRVIIRLATCLENISNYMITADELVDRGFIQTILNVVARQIDDVCVILLSTLKNLMYGNGNYIAMEYGAFPLMVEMNKRLDYRVNIGALNCLMIMTSTPLGKRMALDNDLLQTLANMMCHSENPELDAAVTSVLMFCTIRSEAKQRASKIRTLIPRLIKVSRNHLHATVQMFTFMTLLNLSVHCELRALMVRKYMNLLKKAKCASPMISSIREKLFQELNLP